MKHDFNHLSNAKMYAASVQICHSSLYKYSDHTLNQMGYKSIVIAAIMQIPPSKVNKLVRFIVKNDTMESNWLPTSLSHPPDLQYNDNEARFQSSKQRQNVRRVSADMPL